MLWLLEDYTLPGKSQCLLEYYKHPGKSQYLDYRFEDYKLVGWGWGLRRIKLLFVDLRRR